MVKVAVVACDVCHKHEGQAKIEHLSLRFGSVRAEADLCEEHAEPVREMLKQLPNRRPTRRPTKFEDSVIASVKDLPRKKRG